MIDEHIILVELGFYSFNVTCGFNTKTHFSKKEVLMNWNFGNDWYNDQKVQDKKVEQPFVECWKQTLPNFWILLFAFKLFAIHFCRIEYNFDVIDLFIFVIYDVQYVAIAYGFKINWISIFANHKWTTRVLNALVFVFLKIC